MDVMVMLFIEFLDLQFHFDSMFNSLYIIGVYHFRLYFFSRGDFAVPLFDPLFDLVVPYIAISLQVAHLAPQTAPPAVPPAPTLPDQMVPSLSFDDDEDPFEALALSHGSFGPSDSHTPAEPGMANGFLSSTSD